MGIYQARQENSSLCFPCRISLRFQGFPKSDEQAKATAHTVTMSKSSVISRLYIQQIGLWDLSLRLEVGTRQSTRGNTHGSEAGSWSDVVFPFCTSTMESLNI